MTKQKHSHSALIDAIGPSVLYAEFDLSAQQLHNWRKRGIPDLKRFAISKLAKKKKIALPDDFLAPLQA